MVANAASSDLGIHAIIQSPPKHSLSHNRTIPNADKLIRVDRRTLNGKPTDKPEAKLFVRRMMGIKEKVDTLARSNGNRFQALFVFPSARVEAPWGRTGNVHCLRHDQLWDYIVEKDFGLKLMPERVKNIARAFAQLAHMEVDFTERA